jgi:hypothetical protein
LGGSGAGAGFQLSDAEFGRLSGRTIVIQGEPSDLGSVGADLRVEDLTLDPAKSRSCGWGQAATGG